MNRMELEQQIIDEGKARGIIITKCNIYNFENCLKFWPTIQNNYAKNWIYKYQVEDIIHDLAPLERYHEIEDIDLDKSRYNLFKIGDKAEVDNVWIRLDADEKEPDYIKISYVCGKYRSGWVGGTIFETPEQNDKVLGIKFERDVYVGKPVFWGGVDKIEKAIMGGDLKKVEKGQPLWVGTHSWDIRKL